MSFGNARVLLSLGGAMALGACSDTPLLSLDGLECDDIVVAAIIEDDEVVAGVKLAGCDAVRMSAPSDGSLVAWVLGPEQILESDGQEATNPLERLSVWPAGQTLEERGGAGACDRCTVPVDGDWVIAQPGDHCPPPITAAPRTLHFGDGAREMESEEALIATARRGLRLSWAGDCACRPAPTAPPPEELQVCPVLPATDAWSGDSAVGALGEGGWLGVFGMLHGRVVAPDGRILSDGLMERPFRREVSGVAAFTDETMVSFLVAGWMAPERDGQPELELIQTDGSSVQARSVVGAELNGKVIFSVHEVSARDVLLIGSAPRPDPTGALLNLRVPMFMRYRLPVGSNALEHLGTEELGPTEALDLERWELKDATLTSSGTAVAMATSGELLLRGRSGWAVIRPGPRTDFTFRAARLAALGRTVFACRDAVGESGVIRVRLNEQQSDFESITEFPELGERCLWAEPRPSAGVVRFVLPGSRIVEMTETEVSEPGALRSLPGMASVSLPDARVYLSTDDGWEAVLANARATWYRRFSGGAATQVLGRSDLAGGRIVSAPGPRPRSRAAFTVGGATLVELGGGGDCAGTRTSSVTVPGYPIGQLPEAAVHLGGGRYILLTSSGSALEASWVDLERGVLDHRERWPEIEGGEVYHLELLSPRTLLIVAETKGLYELRDPLVPSHNERPLTLSLEWTDPRAMRSPEARSVERWRAVSVAVGVGWVGGTDVLARVVPSPSGLRVEAYWLSRAALGPFEQPVPRLDGLRPPITALAAECSDVVTFATMEPWDTGYDVPETYPALWRITPSAERPTDCVSSVQCRDSAGDLDPVLAGTELALCGARTFSSCNYSKISRGDVLAVSGSARGPRPVARFGDVHTERYEPLGAPIDRAQYSRPDDLLWFSRFSTEGLGVAFVP